MPKSSFLDRKDDPPRSCNFLVYVSRDNSFLSGEGGREAWNKGMRGCDPHSNKDIPEVYGQGKDQIKE